ETDCHRLNAGGSPGRRVPGAARPSRSRTVGPTPTASEVPMSPVTRRTLLGAAAAAAGGALAPTVLPGGLTPASAAGSLNLVKHVVIFMQENRSFDHYYGTLPGVRGFADTSLVRFPSNGDAFQQTRSGPRGGTVLQPWHLDTATTDAQRVSDLDHSWSGTHSAWNGGLYNN